MALTNTKLMCSLKCRLKQNFLPDLEKLLKYSASAVIVVSYYPCAGSLLRTKWVVLVQDTRSNDSWSNIAWLMHKLCKHAYFI